MIKNTEARLRLIGFYNRYKPLFTRFSNKMTYLTILELVTSGNTEITYGGMRCSGFAYPDSSNQDIMCKYTVNFGGGECKVYHGINYENIPIRNLVFDISHEKDKYPEMYKVCSAMNNILLPRFYADLLDLYEQLFEDGLIAVSTDFYDICYLGPVVYEVGGIRLNRENNLFTLISRNGLEIYRNLYHVLYDPVDILRSIFVNYVARVH